MKCEIIQDLLPSYLDNTCSDETRELIKEHLKECEECQTIIDEFKEIDTISYLMIEEEKPFKKIVRNHRMKIFVMCVFFVFLFLLFGTRINSEFMKQRFNHYVSSHYSEYNLVMTDFKYEDPSSQGFGLDNGYYIASFVSQDEDKKDYRLNVFTEGFIFSIKDTHKNSIEMKNNTCDRLINEYGEDVKKSLLRQKDFFLMNCTASRGFTDGYYEKNIAAKLKSNMEYTKNIDQIIPMGLLLEVNATESDIKEIKSYISSIKSELNKTGFDPSLLSLIIETEKTSYRILNIDCHKDLSSQKIEFE